eukprot:8405235-Heterocapsa_arctica.AAC.1
MDLWRVHKMTPLPANFRPPPGLDHDEITIENRTHLRHCYLEVLKKEKAAAVARSEWAAWADWLAHYNSR